MNEDGLECSYCALTTRWMRPGMRRDLVAKLYDGDAGIAGDGPSPGASARDC